MQKKSFSLAGHRTSVALEPEYWTALDQIATQRGISIATLIAEVDQNRDTENLASALRLTTLAYYQNIIAFNR